jgi:hypothetical protein
MLAERSGSKKGSVFDYLLLSRIYTTPGIILIALLAGLLSRGNLIFDYLFFFDIAFALAIWASMVYLNEAFKTQDGRVKIPFSVPIAFFVFALLIALFRNPMTMIFLFLAAVSTFVYFMKSKQWFGSQYMFLFRALAAEIPIFLSIMLFYDGEITATAITVALSILFVTNSRNLIGDLRDVQFDKYTFPVKFGNFISRIVASVFLIAVLIITPDLSIWIPLGAMTILLLVKKDGYILHQTFVIASEFYFLNYITYLIYPNLMIIANIAYFTTLCNVTYRMVPRRSNPK